MIWRLLAAAASVATAAVLAWSLWTTPPTPQPEAVTVPPAATSTPTAAPVPTVVEGYRLAGTALGRRGRYAVFEDPQGSTEMYRVDDEIPGLGRLLRIGDTDATVATTEGERRFRVRPAPTKVPESTPTARRPRPSPKPAPSATESSPSDDPAPPAS